MQTINNPEFVPIRFTMKFAVFAILVSVASAFTAPSMTFAVSKAPAKKAAKKAAPKAVAKKSAPKAVAKKVAPKAVAKKVAKAVAKKVAPKAVAKKAAPKAVAKKVAKTVAKAKKVVAKKVVAAKKAAPKVVAKKASPKPVVVSQVSDSFVHYRAKHLGFSTIFIAIGRWNYPLCCHPW